jgi:hypothetical protein
MPNTSTHQARRAAQTAFLARSVPLSVTLPAPVAAAVEGECRRTLRTRSEVVADLLSWALPRRLAEDLAHPTAGAVVDADCREAVG